MKRYNKGHILCITLAVLALLSALSIMFMSTSSVERNVSSMAIQNCNAQLAAEAGLEYGISQLRKDFGGTRPITALGTGNWWYQKPMRIITSVENTTNNSDQTVEELFDNAAVEVRLDALHKKQDPTTEDAQVLAVPSYCISNEEEITESENNSNETENESADDIKKNLITQFIPQNAPKNISGVCGNTAIETFNPSVHFPFTLKIVDTTSQFPLNTHVSQNQMNQLMGLKSSSTDYDNNAIAIVGEMLNHLSEEVAKLSAWQSYNPNDRRGPLHGLGQRIIEKRNKQKNSDNKYCGFLSKYDIVGSYTSYTSACPNASSDEITLEDLTYIWDYITVQPTWKEMAVQNIYRQIAPINETESEKKYRIEYRCPVNINTASYPVLMAVLQGISKKGNNSQYITIDHSLANNLAKNIIEIRSGKKIQNDEMNTTNDAVTFKTWTAFNYFIDVLNETYSSNATTANWFTDESWDMLKANFNPNVHLKKTNPDLAIYQNVTKPELSSYTTEFCFFPLGYFEITSLGEQYDDKGNILNSYHIGTTAHIYNTLYHTSQYDFEGGTSGYQTVLTNQNVDNKSEYVAYDPNNIASRISLDYKKAGNNSQSSNYGTGYNAFTLGNNIYKNSTDLSTLWKKASKLYGAVTPVGYHWSNFTANKNIDSSGNTLYTGSATLDNNENAYVFQENFSGDNISINKNLTTNAFPSPDPNNGEVDHSNASYLFSDGLYLQPNMPVQMYEINETNFPPINNDDPLENKGTILFWFKINNQWNDNANDEFHTVFLSNQVKDNIQVQREIKFKVEKPTETALQQADNVFTSAEDYNIKSHTKQYLRKLSIEFISRVTGDNLEASNYAYKETKRTVVFDPCQNLGVHAQEWYHLAVRWQDSKQEVVTPDDETTGEETPFSNGKPTGEENSSETGTSETGTSETGTSEGDFSEENTQDDNNIIESSLSSHIVLCGNFYTAHDRAIIQNDSQAGRIYDTQELTVTKDEKAGESGEYNLTVLKPIEKTLVTSNIEVTQYTNDKITETNFFFIGSPNSNDTPYMTIDDFRISALSESTIDENSKYFPSHAPYPNKTDLKISSASNSSSDSDDTKCYAIYQGRMKLPNDIQTEQRYGSITSFAWTSYGDASLRGHYTANITYANETTTSNSDSENSSQQSSENSSSNESEENSEIDFSKAFELIFTGGSVNKNINYDKAKNQKQLNLENWIYKKVYDNGNVVVSKDSYFHTIDNNNYDYIDWRNISNSNLTSEEKKVLDTLEQQYTSNNSNSSFGHGRNGRAFSNKDKYIDGKLTTSYQVNIKNNTIPGEYYISRKSDRNGKYWYIRYLYDMIFDNIDDLLKYYITTWNHNYSGLIEAEPEPDPEPTYKEKAIKSAIVNFKIYSTVDDCIVPEPYIFTENIDSWVYEIVFPVSTSESSNNNQVFNNAIIDDVTCFYLLDKTDISDRYTVH